MRLEIHKGDDTDDGFDVINRVAQVTHSNINGPRVIFSNSTIEILFNLIYCSALRMRFRCQCSSENYSIEIHTTVNEEEVSLNVEILQCEPENIRCIQFSKITGQLPRFFEVVIKMKEFIGGHKDVQKDL